MAQLTPITQGMQQGAQAIQSNFVSIQGDSNKALEYHTQITLAASSTIVSGTIDFYRKGHQVLAVFDMTLKGAMQWAALATLPTGYRANLGGRFGNTVSSNSYPGHTANVYVSNGILTILTEDSLGGAQSGYVGELIYMTSDDPVTGDLMA